MIHFCIWLHNSIVQIAITTTINYKLINLNRIWLFYMLVFPVQEESTVMYHQISRKGSYSSKVLNYFSPLHICQNSSLSTNWKSYGLKCMTQILWIMLSCCAHLHFIFWCFKKMYINLLSGPVAMLRTTHSTREQQNLINSQTADLLRKHETNVGKMIGVIVSSSW